MNSEKFLQGVMTSLRLDACEQVRAQLCAWADGELSPLQSQLTSQHLEHCAQCNALHTALQGMHTSLSTLRARPVPADFTACVLRRTTARLATATRPNAQSTGSPPTVRLRKWHAWLLRPRLALESAYAISVAVALFGGVTGGMSGVSAFDSEQIANLASRVSIRGQDLVAQARQQVVPADLAGQMSQRFGRGEQQMQQSLQTTLEQGRKRWQMTIDTTGQWLVQLPARLNTEVQQQRDAFNDEASPPQP